MKSEQQVCSLELAQKLKELGINQESVWWWVFTDEERWELVCKSIGYNFTNSSKSYIKVPTYNDEGYGYREVKKMCSTFTVAELGEMLPNYVSISLCGGGRNAERAGYLVCSNANARENWIKSLASRCDYEINFKEIRDKKMADAMAKMLIHLLENKLIDND